MSSYRATDEEKRRELPGDKLVTTPIAVFTQAVTIARSRERVWPWLAQIGADRAGWYSYDFVDNGGRPSAESIRPDHQEVVRGQVIPALPGAKDAFVVADVAPGHFLVLIAPGPNEPIAAWTLLLDEVNEATTRLISRARVSESWRALARTAGGDEPRLLLVHRIYRLLGATPRRVMALLGGMGHRIMERRCSAASKSAPSEKFEEPGERAGPGTRIAQRGMREPRSYHQRVWK